MVIVFVFLMMMKRAWMSSVVCVITSTVPQGRVRTSAQLVHTRCDTAVGVYASVDDHCAAPSELLTEPRLLSCS